MKRQIVAVVSSLISVELEIDEDEGVDIIKKKIIEFAEDADDYMVSEPMIIDVEYLDGQPGNLELVD